VIDLVANQEHVSILRQGVDIWNRWRKNYPKVIPDLSGANFSATNLGSADLSAAILPEANLSNAFLLEANLGSANLSATNLGSADLSAAILLKANLRNAFLLEANLSATILLEANLSAAFLRNADLTRAEVGWTTFGDLDLRTVKGLGTVRHVGPSMIGIDTIYRSGGNIPEAFLRGAGVDDTFITYIRSLVNKPIEFYTCFISYSSKDQEFAQRLYNDLQGNGVRCWFAPEDLKIGDKFRVRIDESIRLYDKLLLILSEHSVKSPWVETEVETAFEKEHKSGKLTLFPVKLDNTVMETGQAWAADIRRQRHIGDFTRWKEHDEYQKGLKRLLRDLKQEAIHDTIESDVDQD
jgi:hypothetical protein